MSYTGNVVPAHFQSLPSVVRFNGTGSQNQFSLGRTIANVQSIIVSVDGVIQDSSKYTVPDGTTLTFGSGDEPSSGTGNVFVYFLGLASGNVTPAA